MIIRRCAGPASLFAVLLCTGAVQAQAPAEQDVLVDKARATSLALGAKLKGQLEAAIEAGGAQSALAVCREIAPALANEVSAQHAVDVGRTALKVRNPANAPDDYERAVLERFVADVQAGTDPTTLEHAETVTQDGRRVFRYMKAIPMAAAPCATCHGERIDPALHARIRDLYPTDAATGFVPGEIRGAFTVVEELP